MHKKKSDIASDHRISTVEKLDFEDYNVFVYLCVETGEKKNTRGHCKEKESD